jgi:uncharacterized cupredoxin-like copper-binding protein
VKYWFSLLVILLISSITPIPGQQSIEVYVEVVPTASGWSFAPADIVIIQNYPIQMTYNNTDTIPHDFNVDYEGGQIHFSVFPNTTSTFSTSYDIPVGTYDFYCAISGHKETGMHGNLFVVGDLDQYTEVIQLIQEGGNPTISTESSLNYQFILVWVILLPILWYYKSRKLIRL